MPNILPAALSIGPSKISHSSLCVYFHASTMSGMKYPAFWTSDQREAELFVLSGESRLSELDRLWQSRQFDKLDNVFQEIENATLAKRRKEESNPPRNIFNCQHPGAGG